MLESKIERSTCDYARSKGWLALKLIAVGWVGFPDRTLMRSGFVFFIEFKAPGKKPRPIQEFVHKKLRALGFRVEVVDDIITGRQLIDEVTNAQ